ncbi:hypothetical protein WICPIJ_009077 [Wickerhamomyces pijperi]|uniref:HMG box domain-containing protein n=1 Tax=Wickerhamomyces pijperi TaxID=599730 RepID=A0A9P8PRY2_WICPI|nr:hypothetical protein WICPIJ_009077 [Wickerhamomyces pijperi]
MLQSQLYSTYPMNPQQTLPPLSQLTAALPFTHQQRQQQQLQQPIQQHRLLQHPQPFQQYNPQYHTPQPVDEAKVSPPLSPKYAAKQPLDRCTCKHDGNHIPRPRNAFILFRQQHHQSVLDEGKVIKTNPDVSRELGRRWRDLSLHEKDYWNRLAEEEKKKHAEKYPGYRYIPRRFGKKGGCPFCKSKQSAKAAVGSASSVSTSPVLPEAKQPVPEDRQNEEHAVALTFLNLRNQPSFQPQAQPQPIMYASSNTSNSSQYLYTTPASNAQPHTAAPMRQYPSSIVQAHAQQPTHYNPYPQPPQQKLPSLSVDFPRPQIKSEHLVLPSLSGIGQNLTIVRTTNSPPSSSTAARTSSSTPSSHKAGSIASFLN